MKGTKADNPCALFNLPPTLTASFVMKKLAKCELRNFSVSCSLVSFVGFVLFLSGCSGTPKHPTWSSATGAEQYERLMWQGIHDQDWANIERHLAPTFVGVNASGRVLDRAGWLEYWKNAHLGEYSLGEVTLQPEGADMVVTYIVHLGLDGKTGPNNGLQVVSVWQTIKGRWTLITASTTSIAPNQGMP